MQSQSSLPVFSSPKLIPTFIKGFNSIANHIVVILFPLALDIFLWLGPHFSIKTIFQPLLNKFITLSGLNNNASPDVISAFKTVWTFIGDRFNIASFLRSYPVGIPSLMSRVTPIQTPSGTAPTVQMSSFFTAFGLILLVFGVGLLLGSIYFQVVAHTIYPEMVTFSLKAFGWNFLQVCLLTISLFILLLIISIPCFLLISLVSIFSSMVAQIILLLLAGFLIWLFIPLLFSPHGIFVYHQNAFQSILTSIKVIRLAMPGSLSFFLLAFVLNQLLNLLWTVPPENSWMMLVGIAGHAFIATGLLAASYVYYNEAMQLLKEIIQKNVPAPQESHA